MPRRRGLVERMRHIETEARKLASSGLHENHSSIEMALLTQGYQEAVKLCANPWTRSELDRLCDQARCPPSGAAPRVGPMPAMSLPDSLTPRIEVRTRIVLTARVSSASLKTRGGATSVALVRA
jgi:hypothetical protein